MAPSRGRPPKPRAFAFITTCLVVLSLFRPTSGQDVDTNSTNVTDTGNVTGTPPPPVTSAPPPDEATIAPPPPPSRPSMDTLKALATKRVQTIARFMKTEDECPAALLAPPAVTGASDRHFLLPPGCTWGPLSFDLSTMSDEDFTREDVPEPERFLEELVVDFELVAVPDASALTSTDVVLMVPTAAADERSDGGLSSSSLQVAVKSYIRVLPAQRTSPTLVDTTTVPYNAVDRLLAAFEDDAITTTATASSVAAILTPDAPGTYVVLITAVDACNSTSHAFVNVTALCSHMPQPVVGSNSLGVSLWDQASAANYADDAHPLGWWAPRVLDGTQTLANDLDEAYYFNHKLWVDTEIWGGDSSAVNFSSDLSTPLKSSEVQTWIWWNTAPVWNVGYRETDGFLYQWHMTSAPEGSNAWRRNFNDDNSTDGNPTLFTESGALIVHASAPENGDTPFVDDASTVYASFTPDVVGTFGFRLDVMNVCHAASAAFVSSFQCNASPTGFYVNVTTEKENKQMCLARRTVEAAVTDADGDDVFVRWSHAVGGEGWGDVIEDIDAAIELPSDTSDVSVNATSGNSTNGTAVETATETKTESTDSNATASNATSSTSDSTSTSVTPDTAVTTVDLLPPQTFSDGVTYTGARRASGGAVLSSYVGNKTSLQPDVPGVYALVATLTDGCTVTTSEVFVEVEWDADCDDLGLNAESSYTAVPIIVLIVVLSVVWWVSKNLAHHPLDPNVILPIAKRLREWELRKTAVKRARLRLEYEIEVDMAKDSGTSLMEYNDREHTRRAMRALRRRDQWAQSFASTVAYVTGAREEQSALVPATTHVWRLTRFVSVFAEASTIASLSFLGNTSPWWGQTLAKVGRGLSFQFNGDAMYLVNDVGVVAVSIAAVASIVHWRFSGFTDQELTGNSTNREHARTGKDTSLTPTKPPSRKLSSTSKNDAEAREANTQHFIATWTKLWASFVLNTLPFVIWTVGEPLMVPIVASAAASVTCVHRDPAAPFPHLARDADSACYGTDEAVTRFFTAVIVAGIILPLVAVYFVVCVAPTLDPIAVEQPLHAVFRITVKWFLAMFCVTRGEGDMTRWEPRGDSYGVPSGMHKGYPTDSHFARDESHLAILAMSCFALYAINFQAQPVRGAGASVRLNAVRGAALACAFWSGTYAFFVTTRTSPPTATGTVTIPMETTNAAVLLFITPLFFYLGWRHTVLRTIIHAYPDLSPMEMRRAKDPRVRALGVLASNETDGLCGAFGNWEGHQQHALNVIERKKKRGIDYSAVSERLGVDRTPGVGLQGLTDEGITDTADDALVWQIVMQVYFVASGSGKYGGLQDERGEVDGVKNKSNAIDDVKRHKIDFDSSSNTLQIDPSVRVHFCDAISALATTSKGVGYVQKHCLVPLLRRLLLDDDTTNAVVRLKAAEAMRNLAKTKRGASLLCQSDNDAFITSIYQRQRDWSRVLIHIENKWGRVVSDLSRIYYYLGFGTQKPDELTFAHRDRFDALVAWNVRRWLDDGPSGFPVTKGGGGDDDGRGFGDSERLSVSKRLSNSVTTLYDLLVTKVVGDEYAYQRKLKSKEKSYQKYQQIRRARAKRGDITTSECLSRTVRDLDCDVAMVITCIRAVGDYLDMLRVLRGKPDPRVAERRLRDFARNELGPIWRPQGIVGYRTLFEEWTTVADDDILLQTVPGARVMMKRSELEAKKQPSEKKKFDFGEFKEKVTDWYANFSVRESVYKPFMTKAFGFTFFKKDNDESDDEVEGEDDDDDSDDDSMVSVSVDGDLDTGRDDIFLLGEDDGHSNANIAVFHDFGRTNSRSNSKDPTLKFRVSPMDAALDAGAERGAPGLLESLVACTAHSSARVRTAAHEELRRAAQHDDVATIARRALLYAVAVDSSNDSFGRVRALEWLNSLVVARYRVLADAAALVADREHKEALADFHNIADKVEGGFFVGDRSKFSFKINDTSGNRVELNQNVLATTEDYSLLHPGLAAARSLSRAVDISLGVGDVEPATACVDAVLSRPGLTTITRCLEDKESSPVRVAAIQTLRDAWETLAAVKAKDETADDETLFTEYDDEATTQYADTSRYALSSTRIGVSRSSWYTDGTEGTGGTDLMTDVMTKNRPSVRVVRFRSANAFAGILFCAENDPDTVVRRAAETFITRITQTEGEDIFDEEPSDSDKSDSEWSDAPFMEAQLKPDIKKHCLKSGDNNLLNDSTKKSLAQYARPGDDEDDESDNNSQPGSGTKSVTNMTTVTGVTLDSSQLTNNEINVEMEPKVEPVDDLEESDGSEVSTVSDVSLSSQESFGKQSDVSSWRFGRKGEENRFHEGDEIDDGDDDGAHKNLYRAAGQGVSRWDQYVRQNAPPTVRYARTKLQREQTSRRPPAPGDTSTRDNNNGLSRFSSFVSTTRRADVEHARREPNAFNATQQEVSGNPAEGTPSESNRSSPKKAPVEEGEAQRERRELRARGARMVRARIPKRSAAVAGTALAPTRADVGDLTGPGPAVHKTRDPNVPLAPVDENRLTWRERAAEYILAGGGGGGVGGQRRGPHERALLRNGYVGLTGRRGEGRGGFGGGVGAAPHEMFPNRSGSGYHPNRIGTSVRAPSVYDEFSEDGSANAGADRYAARSRYAGSVGSAGSGDEMRDGTGRRGTPKGLRKGLRDGAADNGLHREDSRLHDFDGFDFEALAAARVGAASQYAATDDDIASRKEWWVDEEESLSDR